MNQRATDTGFVKIDRTIPLWGVLVLSGTVAGSAILFWAGQRELAIELKGARTQIQEMALVIKTMDDQLRMKDTKDVVRDERIADHERRLTRIETKLEAK